jgi:uncharacterized repeat protein (TIGR03943 family)
VRRLLPALVLLLTGAGLLRIALLTELCLRYVKEGLRPYLVVSGVLLVLSAVAGLRAKRTRAGAHDSAHQNERGHGNGHDHSRHPRIAWLLILPALAMLAFAPPALGSYTANRENNKRVSFRPHFAPLPAGDPVPLSLGDYIAYAEADREHHLQGRRVQLTGFATPGKHGRWQLTRLVVTCCAADSQVLKVAVHGTPSPPADAWVTITGTWHRTGKQAALDVTKAKRIDEPPNPYMDTVPGRQF